MKYSIFKTNNDWIGVITRLTVGGVLFPHGAQKMLGLFGGYGFNGTMQFLTSVKHLPWIIGFLVIVIELFGSICLIGGFASRLWAALIAVVMIGIILTSHVGNGFFMNWFGDQKGEGYEYFLLVIGLSLATVLNGSGKYSLDEKIERNWRLQMLPHEVTGQRG